MSSFSLQVAWSVVRTSSLTGRSTPVVFPTVLVNAGNAWQPFSNTVNIPATGYYYLSFGIGMPPHNAVDFNLKLSSETIFDIHHPSTSHNGISSVSRSGIWKLSSGSVLSLSSDQYDNVFADSGKQTYFIGFLIKPEI